MSLRAKGIGVQILMQTEWDVPAERVDEYSDFVKRSFIPKCNELGLLSVGGFYVEVGFGPTIISVKRVESLEDLFRVMSVDEFSDLVGEVKRHCARTAARSCADRPARGVPYEIQKGVWKYNQYYDVLPGKRAAYANFVINEYVPMLEASSIWRSPVGWNVLIGGVSEIIGELTFKDPSTSALCSRTRRTGS